MIKVFNNSILQHIIKNVRAINYKHIIHLIELTNEIHFEALCSFSVLTAYFYNDHTITQFT